MKECFKSLTDKLYWNNPEGDHCPFDLTKPLPLKGRPGRPTVAAEYFSNNDLEFLKSSDPEKKYTMSITKTKATRYEIMEIEDMKILSMVSVSVKKLHGYGHLEEIAVKRANRQQKGVGPSPCLHFYIWAWITWWAKLSFYKSWAVRLVQHKLFQLDGSDIVDLIMALRMFTRSLIIKRRVEDLQLGVESYQKKLNITKPQKTFPGIEFKELYTPSYKPLGVDIIEDREQCTGAGALGYGGAQNIVRNANPCQRKAGLSTHVEYVFKADDCNTFHVCINKAPTPQNYVHANLAISADPEQVELYERRASLKEKVEDKLDKQDQSLNITQLCKPKPYYNEQNKVAIGYKNPLCLTRAKQVQPALYNGYEIIKNNHVPALVHNTEDTLEIAEITRRKINDKMKDPECVTHKVKIAPPDYSKENYLATFTPQKQLTPEQIFWSQDLIKMKEEALKKQTTASRPIKALTVYPPNTPATLVPRVLPTKSQVKINIFTLIQLFLEFEKTCKKRITPTGLTEGERGFKQTRNVYLPEVIPFFKTLKEHFEGIQKALTKEIKEMKDIFEELEAEVDQNVVNRKHDEIEQKNLLIANDNLIADCLSKEVFYIATNSELTVSRFTEMHEAHTICSKHVVLT
ncbi:hypothetical protein Tco_1016209 [Tanacetum coccineum]|uniref:Uncharacterized protein n=1 Tax=Tanacetum coccineum TaxID=301880 RepID=A0ABQ5FP12_9ASTR